MNKAFTSDGVARSNIAQFAIDMPSIPYSIGLSARINVLADLGDAINENGGTVKVIDRSAAYDQGSITQRINDISTALNAMGATPALPIYDSIDYNSFTSIIGVIVTAMAAMP